MFPGNRTIFGSILPTDLYDQPSGFCWDALCSDEPLIDDPESPEYNINKKVQTFMNIYNAR